MADLFVDPWLWAPAAASLLAPVAARWRTWAGWATWGLALVGACVGFLFVAAGTVLLGGFGSLLGFSPDWGAAATSFAAPAALSIAGLAGTGFLTHRVARSAEASTLAEPAADGAGSSAVDRT